MGKKYSAGTSPLLGSGDVVLPPTDDPPYFAMLQWRNCFFCTNLLTKASFSHFRRGCCHQVWVTYNFSSKTESPVVGGTFALVAATGGGQCGFVGDEYESESECCCYSIIVVAGGRIFIMCCESIIIVIIGGNIV